MLAPPHPRPGRRQVRGSGPAPRKVGRWTPGHSVPACPGPGSVSRCPRGRREGSAPAAAVPPSGRSESEPSPGAPWGKSSWVWGIRVAKSAVGLRDCQSCPRAQSCSALQRRNVQSEGVRLWFIWGTQVWCSPPSSLSVWLHSVLCNQPRPAEREVGWLPQCFLPSLFVGSL